MSNDNSIDSLLEPFQHFGVNLGLTRIKKLLADLGDPQQQIPLIHVAGTNGKGSVCAYLSSILTQAGYRVGRYISPHLVDWTERICLNEQSISNEDLINVLNEINQKIAPNSESPTQFEVITAAAWLYFASSQVDVVVMEVGLGGRLDATNVCDRSLVSIITSISKEHWQRLGPTVADIAGEKAGILKPNCPAVIGILPPEAQTVVAEKTKALNCPTVWIEPATATKPGWAKYREIEYPLPLLGGVQLINSAIAIATCQILQQQGWQINQTAIVEGMKKTRWLGRLQWTTWQNRSLLIDGAHNPAAAKVLREYVDTLNQPVIWVIGILATKDHEDILQALLRPQDELHLVPVRDHSTADPKELAALAQKICPQLKQCQTYSDLFVALQTVWDHTSTSEPLVILCGSLYLLGYFLRQSTINN